MMPNVVGMLSSNENFGDITCNVTWTAITLRNTKYNKYYNNMEVLGNVLILFFNSALCQKAEM